MKRINCLMLIMILVCSSVVLPAQAEVSTENVQACMNDLLTAQKESGLMTRWNDEDRATFTTIVEEYVSLDKEQKKIFQEKLEDPYCAILYINELAYGHPFFWDIEKNAWFDEAMVQLGLMEQVIDILPSENEMGQKEAIALAEKEAAQLLSIDPDTLSAYKKSVQYFDHLDGNGPQYQIEFYKETEKLHLDFTVHIYNHGAAVQVVNNIPSTLEERYNDTITQKGPFRFWTLKEKFDFMSTLPQEIHQAEMSAQIVPTYLYDMQNNKYGLPPKEDMQEKQIVALAQAYLVEHANVTDDFTKMKIATYYKVDDPQNPRWEIAFYYVNHLYTVALSKTGEVLGVPYDHREPSALTATSEAVQKAVEYEKTLYQQKPDHRLWTIEERATLHHLQKVAGTSFSILDTLPNENEITQEEAYAIAQKKMMENKLLTEGEKCIVSVHFYEYVESKVRVWFFGFYKENQEGIFVSVDSKTGEVIEVRQEPNG